MPKRKNFTMVDVPVQRFSREDPTFLRDALEAAARTVIGGRLGDPIVPSLWTGASQAQGQVEEGVLGAAAALGAKYMPGVGPLLRSAAGPVLSAGSAVAGPLSAALGRAYRPDVSGSTINPGGRQGQMFQRGVASHADLVEAIEAEESRKRQARIDSGDRLTMQEWDELTGHKR